MTMEPMAQKGQERKNLDRISRSAELIYRRAAMLNLYLCRIHAADLEKKRLTRELETIQALICEMEQEIASAG